MSKFPLLNLPDDCRKQENDEVEQDQPQARAGSAPPS